MSCVRVYIYDAADTFICAKQTDANRTYVCVSMCCILYVYTVLYRRLLTAFCSKPVTKLKNILLETQFSSVIQKPMDLKSCFRPTDPFSRKSLILFVAFSLARIDLLTWIGLIIFAPNSKTDPHFAPKSLSKVPKLTKLCVYLYSTYVLN